MVSAPFPSLTTVVNTWDSPVPEFGANETISTDPGAPGAEIFETETAAVLETPPHPADTVTAVVADTGPAVTLKEAEDDPAGMGIDAGTGRIPGAEDARATGVLVTAGAFRITAHLATAPE